MTTSQQEVANDNIKVAVSRAPRCRVTFDIHVAPKATEAAYAKALRGVNKEVSLPGFRKGKAPTPLVIKHYGTHVDREWRNELLEAAFAEALELTKISPLHRNSVEAPEIKTISANDGAEVTFRFESRPEVPAVDISQLTLTPVQKKEVTQDQIDRAIQDLRLYHADWKDVTDRPVQDGDYVDLDIDAVESPAYNICTNERFEVNTERMPNWMHQLVVGLSVGESAEGISERDEKFIHSVDPAEFKPTKVRVAVKSIKQAELPPIDDSLAQKAGAENEQVLKERVVASLERNAAAAVEMDLQKQLEQQLIEKFPFEVPQTIVEAERQTRVRNRLRSLRSHGATEAEAQQQRRQIEQLADQDALVFTHLYFLLLPLAQEQQFSVTQTDLLQELTRQMHQLPLEEQLIETNMEPEILRGKLVAILTIRKAEEWLINQLIKQ